MLKSAPSYFDYQAEKQGLPAAKPSPDVVEFEHVIYHENGDVSVSPSGIIARHLHRKGFRRPDQT